MTVLGQNATTIWVLRCQVQDKSTRNEIDSFLGVSPLAGLPAGWPVRGESPNITIDFVTGRFVLNLTPENPDRCGVLVQKCHFGFLGCEHHSFWGRLGGEKKVDLGSLLRWSG